MTASINASTSAGVVVTSDTSGALALQTAGTTAVTIDTSQQVGLGVVPNTWYAGYTALEFGGYGSLTSRSASNDTELSSNAYRNASANYIYKKNGTAQTFDMANGIFYWNTAGSGTAGGTITFNPAMTLDASGNLLVGTTSSAGRFTVNGSTADSTANCVSFRDSSSTSLFIVRDDGRISTGGASSPYSNTTASAANMYVDSSGIFYRSTSSLKYKTDVQNTAHGLTDLLKLRSVTYKGKTDGEIVFGGLIAEEVHDAGLTEFVQYSKDGSPDALAYGNMVSLCIKAIQELNTLITAQAAEIAALKAKVGA